MNWNQILFTTEPNKTMRIYQMLQPAMYQEYSIQHFSKLVNAPDS